MRPVRLFRLFIAEKPSLARAIADALPGPRQKRQGYIEFDTGDVVTWCAGHILELAEPEAYRPEYKTWSANHLPIVPDTWRLAVTAPDLLRTIKGLLPAATEVVHAGDPDREGQLLVDEVLEYLGYRGKVSRLIVNDLSAPAVRKALAALKSNTNFRGLYDAARARQRADWLYGLNLTRLYTLLGRAGGHEGILSVGRVQTPVLGLVVRRDLEIEGFRPAPYYVLMATFASTAGERLKATWIPPAKGGAFLDKESRLASKSHADAIAARIAGQVGYVTKSDREQTSEPPPLPYCLSELQIEAGRRFGWSPKVTLEVCQALYEVHRLTTYPRSDCAHLPEGQLEQGKAVLETIGRNLAPLQPLVRAADPSLKSRAWADSKVSAHHAIIPTTVPFPGAGLGEPERLVYEVIARRYIAQFYPAFRFNQTILELVVQGETFRASGRQPIDPGWHAAIPPRAKDGRDEEEGGGEATPKLPELAKGEAVRVEEIIAVAKKTEPPKRFTDATLLRAMTGIAAFVTDPKIREILRATDGIGTPATQAAIIETLYDRAFIARQDRHLVSTPIGRSLVQILPPIATTPDMTALWEAAMKKIASGHMPLDAFLDGVVRQLTDLIASGRAKGPLVVPGARPCPAPGCQGVLRVRRSGQREFLACTRFPDCKVTAAVAGERASGRSRRPPGRAPPRSTSAPTPRTGATP
jgi:DNA topoisomerase-3